ncbi:tRNA pseudouridine(38-40) synthase TruA [Corynebacterium sp. zg912]|uniref:tRNA pseudouridine synthase A n=1 Tax=Corynebacterium wankanglinii TaxID=2735136 RepID=A0A7H0KAY0_9CORY|nr:MULTISPECIES: tRNA pseudouridine(38-40) synthase TruA [Corynebacterium]MBA1836763.1 tRNA pseudouridine(38-40) synthase TruA [Corynebacterium wankanglinii]MCR5929597.1 tRNA pseudouridine(38-40) synthase TruA [Corynebacterium sp. zg912]QNP94446.1 tRNA pseudouridine(38-40) synthase TruA [Corynebacterium wankanglinii]
MDDTLRLRLDIAYDGTDFHGWARQKGDLRTVQQTIEDALSLVLRSQVRLTVAGRTDAGVHASGQVAHTDIPAEALNQRSIEGDPGRLVRRLAKLLPEDVRVVDVREAPAGFDARFSALTRSYLYRVTTHPAGALPTRARDTAVWPKPVELEAVQACADALVGLHDFAAFCRPKEHATTIRDVHSFTWAEVSPTLYEARITADAFCWNMVRALVATCLTVGEGRRGAGWPQELLLLDARSAEVPLAPARGLTLVGVDYPPEGELAARAEATRARREM